MTGEFDAQTIDTALQQPVSKLDAEQYSAEDIDGITESLFGSGNLNFLMLQAGQTNGVIAATDPFSATGDNLVSSIAFASSVAMPSGPAHSDNSLEFAESDDAGTESAPVLIADANPDFSNDRADIDFPASALATPAGSGLAIGRVVSSGVSSFSGGGPGAEGAPGTSGSDGTNGQNGIDGEPGDGTTVINEGDTLIDIDLGDTTINLGDIVIDLGDVTNIVTNITNCLIETVTDLGGGLTLQLDAVLGENSLLGLDIIQDSVVTEIIDHAIDLSPVTSLLDTLGLPLPLDAGNLILADLSSTIGLLGDSDPQHGPGDTDLGIGLDLGAGQMPLVDSITDLAFNPVEDLAGDIDILSDINLDLFDTSNIDNSAGDSDISLGLDTALAGNGILPGIDLDIPLDPLEALTGDIDLDLGAGLNLLGENAGGLIDNFAGGSGDDNFLSDIRDGLGGAVTDLLPEPLTDGPLLPDISLDLLDPAGTDNGAGDTDLNLGLDLGIGGIEIIDTGPIEIPLDPIESILGDIDLEIGAALDIVNPDSGGFLDTDFSGTPENLDALGDWTESIIPGGDAFAGDMPMDALGDTLGGVLEAPVGNIAEGLGSLLGGAEHAPSGGGLFGGGLFR